MSASDRGDSFEVVIGLEVHCELATSTKLFCSCANAFGDEPNTNICPVCLGLPGSLPVLNKKAVELAMRIGLALNCSIVPSTFARKNYFYPDMPKDYQISQYDEPINVNGYVDLADGTRVGIVRAHIEEDTGKSTHIGGKGRIQGADYSLIDYNRAGVPLVEIVSAPDIRSSEQARAYVSELRSILVAVGASDGRMEEGSLRVDANISVRPLGSEVFGTRTEVKNLNSLRSLGRAIEFEADRQVAIVTSGERVVQETRHFEENQGVTSSMRSKEEANDYRYFPEPDLVPLRPDDAFVESIRAGIGLLPAQRRERLNALVGAGDLTSSLSDQVATTVDLGLDDLVADVVKLGANPRLALARTANEAARHPEQARSLDAALYAQLIGLESRGEISATQAKVILDELCATGEDPRAIAQRLGYEALGDDALEQAIDAVIEASPAEWTRFLAGDERVAQFLLGKVMKETKGKANGKAVAESFARRK